MTNYPFENYRTLIKNTPDFSTDTLLPDSFLLEKEGKISIYYAPFEYVNENAKIVLVGITPGLQQAVNALNTAKIGLVRVLKIPPTQLSSRPSIRFIMAM